MTTKKGKKKKAAAAAAPAADSGTISSALFGLDPKLQDRMGKELGDEGYVPSGSKVWKPTEPGEDAMGILYMKKEVASRFKPGETYRAYGLRREDDMGAVEETVILSSAVIDRELGKIPVGTWVKVVFKGTVPSKQGQNPTKIFAVFTNPRLSEEYKHLNYDEVDFNFGANADGE